MSGNQSMYLSYFLYIFFMVSSSDLKYKLMRRDFQPITFLDCFRTDFMYFYMKLKKNSVWYNFYQGTSVSITFYIFEHYQQVKPKGSSFQRHQNCVCGTLKSGTVTILS